jgi:hypothetical protein
MKHDVLIVSGLSRSGSSLMMRMLQAADIALLVDEHLHPDQHNPRGYYEYQPVNFKETIVDSLYRASRENRAVKLLAPRIDMAPPEFNYKVIWMKRPFTQIIASKQKMAECGTWFNVELRTPERLREIVRKSSAHLLSMLDAKVCVIDHNSLFLDPFVELEKIKAILPAIDTITMAKCMDPSLWRNRPSPITV